MSLNENEAKVLEFLVAHWSEEAGCYPFAPLMRELDMDRPTVRRACRSLARKGSVGFVSGLMSDDGDFMGAGYCACRAGREFLKQDA
jgi:hypothetical protein